MPGKPRRSNHEYADHCIYYGLLGNSMYLTKLAAARNDSAQTGRLGPQRFQPVKRGYGI